MEGGNSSTRPHFFKVLMPGFSAKMLIPRQFNEHLAKENHHKATILSPLGKFWHVNLEREGYDIYFSNGWKEFTQAHDFTVGYFLVFRYEGNMVFTIKVFDLSGCLKEYNKSNNRCSKGTKAINEYGGLDDVCKNDIWNGVDCHIEEKKSKINETEECSDEKKDMKMKPAPLHSSKKIRNLTKFEKIVRPYHLDYKVMGVPREFCLMHGLITRREIVLKDMNDRSWRTGFYPGTRESYIRNGWEEFREANRLEEGDRCIFQLVSPNEMRVRVVKRQNG